MRWQGFASALRAAWIPALLTISMFTGLAVYGGRPMASYRAIALGADTSQLGIIAASFAAIAAFVAVPLGRVVDRRSERQVLMVGLGLVVVALGIVAVADSLPVLAFGLAALGAGHLSVVLACQNMVANRTAARHHAQLIGAYTSATSVGHVLGPAIAGALATDAGSAGRDPTFFVLAAALVLLGLVLSPVLPGGPIFRGSTAEKPRDTVLATLRRPGMTEAMVAGIIGLLAIDLLLAYLPAYGLESGIGPQVVGFALSALALSQLASRFALSRLVERLPQARLLAASLVIPGLVVPLLVFPLTAWQLVIVCGLIGSALGICQPMSLVLTIVIAPLQSRGLAMGVRIAGNRLGMLVLPATIGATIGQAGVSAIFVSLGVLLVMAGGFVTRSGRYFRRPGNDESAATVGEGIS